jgi:hypothetical protein
MVAVSAFKELRGSGEPPAMRMPAGVQLVEDVLPAASGGSGWTSRR